VQERPIPDETPCDEQEGRARRGGRFLGRGQEGAHPDAGLLPDRLVQQGSSPPSQRCPHALAQVPVRGQIEAHPAVAAQVEVDLRVGERQADHRLRDVGGLGRLGLQELEPGRRVPEEVAHLELRPLGHADLGVLELRARLVAEAPAGRGPRALGLEQDPRDRGDRRQGFAAKAEGEEPPEILGHLELRRGVAEHRQPGLLEGHAAAVVDHANQTPAPGLDLDVDAASPRVDGVLGQLLDDRRGTLDDLARRDLVREGRRQHLNARGLLWLHGRREYANCVRADTTACARAIAAGGPLLP